MTGWMSFRAVGSGLFLFWIFSGNERSAPSEWIVPFIGDFFIGITAIFLVYYIIKKPSTYYGLCCCHGMWLVYLI